MKLCKWLGVETACRALTHRADLLSRHFRRCWDYRLSILLWSLGPISTGVARLKTAGWALLESRFGLTCPSGLGRTCFGRARNSLARPRDAKRETFVLAAS